MTIYEDLITGKTSLAVVGLGYVGMPLAVAFSKKVKVIGFDTNEEKVKTYLKGSDPTKEVGDEIIRTCNVQFTSRSQDIAQSSFIIVAVPTPINQDKTPDLNPVEKASTLVGRHLQPGAIVVYESTVYPGVTEDICIPILEKTSGLVSGKDFFVGYSPERINPGDKVHRLENITKIVSGINTETCNEIANVYNLVVEVGTFPVSSIKTAEAIKVVENSQRDVNIAFMNELAIVFDRMGINTQEVVAGMNTKWNALGFHPGLVGGHCIGVDPYYFTYEAEKLGYHSQIILAGRKINDSMGEFVADAVIKQLVLANKAPKKSRVAILGLTFKEDCPDLRNSKVVDIISRLQEYGISPLVVEPMASAQDAEQYYGIKLIEFEKLSDCDCIIIAVAHTCFRELPYEELLSRFAPDDTSDKILVDVKGIIDRKKIVDSNIRYWSL